jgi:hypothetical protein
MEPPTFLGVANVDYEQKHVEVHKYQGAVEGA